MNPPNQTSELTILGGIYKEKILYKEKMSLIYLSIDEVNSLNKLKFRKDGTNICTISISDIS